MVIKHYVRSDPTFENVHVRVCDVHMCLEKDEDEQCPSGHWDGGGLFLLLLICLFCPRGRADKRWALELGSTGVALLRSPAVPHMPGFFY